MQTRVQLFLDKNIVKPVIVCLNLFVRVAGKILRINHSLDRNFKVIAVCKYKGMGSIIQATPLLRTLRKKFPQAKIIFITTQANKELLDKFEFIDEVISVDDYRFIKFIFHFPFFILKLISARIEIYFDLEIYSNFSSLVTTMSMAKNRVGYYLRSSNYRLGIYTHMMFFNTNARLSQTYLQLARLIHCNEIVDHLFPLQSSVQSIQLDGQPYNLQTGKYIVVNPNASDLRIERRWSQDNFAALIKKILEADDSHLVILTGSKKEKPFVEELLHSCGNPGRVYSLAGKTNLEELVALIQHAALTVTNDTGPMHIAFSAGTKTVSLFGPCSPAQQRNTQNNISIYRAVYCSPCVHEFSIPPCKGDNQCMKLIAVNEVFDAVQEMFSRGNNFISTEKSDQTIYLSSDGVLGKVNR